MTFSDDSEQSLYSTKKRIQACTLFAGAINHGELKIGFGCRFGNLRNCRNRVRKDRHRNKKNSSSGC
jgi:hypothetical protein